MIWSVTAQMENTQENYNTELNYSDTIYNITGA